MAHKTTFEVKFRRRREEKTNYAKRLKLLLGKKPRIVFRKSNKKVLLQAIEFNPIGDKTICETSSLELKKFGWNASKKNLPASYLTGLLFGLKAKKTGLKEGIFDLGLLTPIHGSGAFAALKGIIDNGISIKASEEVFPSEERITGKHISEHSKNNSILKMFEETKKNILNSTGVEKK